MPTAIEYGVMKQWHAQNGAGTGPPAQHQAAVAQPDITPAAPSAGEWLLTGLLLVVAIAAAGRRRLRRTPAPAPEILLPDR
jgi:hypothetical protein